MCREHPIWLWLMDILYNFMHNVRTISSNLVAPSTSHTTIYTFIKYMVQIWPRYSQRGLHIRITRFSLKKTSDTALFSVIALTTFKCIVRAMVTKGALVRFVVTVHWRRHRSQYGVTEVYRALRNIKTVHLNNVANRADLGGISKHCEMTAKAGRQSTIYTGDLMRFSLWNKSIFIFWSLWAMCSPWDIEQRVGPSALELHLTGDVSSLGSMDK